MKKILTVSILVLSASVSAFATTGGSSIDGMSVFQKISGKFAPAQNLYGNDSCNGEVTIDVSTDTTGSVVLMSEDDTATPKTLHIKLAQGMLSPQGMSAVFDSQLGIAHVVINGPNSLIIQGKGPSDKGDFKNGFLLAVSDDLLFLSALTDSGKGTCAFHRE